MAKPTNHSIKQPVEKLKGIFFALPPLIDRSVSLLFQHDHSFLSVLQNQVMNPYKH